MTILDDVLDEVEAYLEQREDVRDGSDRRQLPNEEMLLLMRLREARTAIAKAKGGA